MRIFAEFERSVIFEPTKLVRFTAENDIHASTEFELTPQPSRDADKFTVQRIRERSLW
jgi:hypothetical protein